MCKPISSNQTLHPVLPFDFGQSLTFIKGFAPCSEDLYCAAKRLTTGGYAGELPFTATVEESGRGDVLQVEIAWLREPGNPERVKQWLTSFLSLDDDLRPLYRAADGDPVFKQIVKDLHGYHHVRFPTPFEAACWAALSQRTPWQVSRQLKQKLVQAAGEIARIDNAEIALFPTPERVMANRGAVERAISQQRKTRTIVAAAEAFLASDLNGLDDDSLQERLKEIWGFGEWSSEFVLLRGFGRLSRIPTSERRFREAAARLYSLQKREASEGDLQRLGQRYGEHIGYWAHYIRVWAHQLGARRKFWRSE